MHLFTPVKTDSSHQAIWRAIKELEAPLGHSILHQLAYNEEEDLLHQRLLNTDSLSKYQEKFFDVAGLQKTLIAIYQSIVALLNQNPAPDITKFLDAWLLKVILFQLDCVPATALDPSHLFFRKAAFALQQIENEKCYGLGCYLFGKAFLNMGYYKKDDTQKNACFMTAFRYFVKCHDAKFAVNEDVAKDKIDIASSAKDFIIKLGYHFLKDSGMEELEQETGDFFAEDDPTFVQSVIDKVSTLRITDEPTFERNGRDTQRVVADLVETLPIALDIANKYRAKAMSIQQVDDFLKSLEQGRISIDDDNNAPVDALITKGIALVRQPLCKGYGVAATELESALTTINNSSSKNVFVKFIAQGKIDLILDKKVETFEEFKDAVLQRNVTLLALKQFDTPAAPAETSDEEFIDEAVTNAVKASSRTTPS